MSVSPDSLPVRHKVRTALRIVVQLGLTGPIFLLGALAWPFLIIPFLPSFWTQFSFGGLILACGAYGILALPFSIFLPLHLVHRSKGITIALVVFLAGGCLTAISIFFSPNNGSRTLQKTLENIWVYGGPVVVAVWNTIRFLKRPSQLPTPQLGYWNSAK